ncbi:peptidylprolyl isomerase [Aurantimonas aggregata]|uniref:Peptidylprolyl isomerase n=1 Tax=Aurantimonas aggregata TaxID=2047720 RepID=A0A6L9MGP8_9HYPH|nr:SurA N-terminal domain-containing protein [Aurantimonas aggregata]NDV86983.1 peptidylprolyl isomerase [Aurantimonas aggregata]
MTVHNAIKRAALAIVLSTSTAAVAPLLATPVQAASEVSVVVNRQPITSFQIRQRAAFLQLRRVGGNATQKATEELIDEELKKQEIRRRGINVPDTAVNEAYGRFASENNMNEQQLAEVLSRAGFSSDAFKDYIRVQMGWGQAVQAHMRSAEKMSEQDVVQRMLAQGGQKPSTTEYTLQQVIFVIPEGQRGALLGQRKREADGMRARFQSCDATYTFAKGLRDVTVRDLGRVAQPELPALWKDDVIKAGNGKTTPAKETERGVEYIAICGSRSISDDKVAAMVFQSSDLAKLGEQSGGPDGAFLKKLRDEAQISRR